MKRTWVVAIALVCLVMIPVAARAAVDRTVVGSITNIAGTNVTVKGQDGKEDVFMLNTKTRISRGKEKVDAKELKVGDRVVAYGREDKSMIDAKTISISIPSAK